MMMMIIIIITVLSLLVIEMYMHSLCWVNNNSIWYHYYKTSLDLLFGCM